MNHFKQKNGDIKKCWFFALKKILHSIHVQCRDIERGNPKKNNCEKIKAIVKIGPIQTKLKQKIAYGK